MLLQGEKDGQREDPKRNKGIIEKKFKKSRLFFPFQAFSANGLSISYSCGVGIIFLVLERSGNCEMSIPLNKKRAGMPEHVRP